MTARAERNNGLWVGTALAVLVILAAAYWWRDDLRRWLTTTATPVMDQAAGAEDGPVLVEPATSGPQGEVEGRSEPGLAAPPAVAEEPAPAPAN